MTDEGTGRTEGSLARYVRSAPAPRVPLKVRQPDDASASESYGLNGKDALPILSLFCGAGGLDLGFVLAGFDPSLAADIDTRSVETYNWNHPSRPPHLPLARELDLSSLSSDDVLRMLRELPSTKLPVGVIGGPPCQAFSMSNVHKSTDDPRARLPISYAEILRGLKDEIGIHFFVFENVFGLRQKGHARQFADFKNLFDDAGFRIFESELDAFDFGVAQHRRRVFLVGFNRTLYPNLNFVFPSGSGGFPRTVREALSGLPPPMIFQRGLRPVDIEKASGHPNHWCMRPRSRKFFDGSLKQGDMTGRALRVLSWDRPSWTVAYGNREVHVHPSGSRRLSVLEAMRLQGFPDWYELRGTLSDQIRLISDAVPPQLGEALGRSIRRAFDDLPAT